MYANSAHPGLDDAALVRRVQAGDEGAFTAIFKRHHAPLLSYCRHMLANRDEGEDALQQAFIKAHQALHGGTAPRELRPWLYAIARNCCLSAIAARRPSVPLDVPLEDRTPALAGLSDQVHQREDLRELVAAIGRLPEDQRSALLLAELDDLSHQAIAAIVGCPVSKVKALIYQARSALIADRDARDASCLDIREQLSVAHGGELRRGPLRRHLKLCSGCRDFQLALNAQHQSLAAVLPVLPSAGLAVAILGHGAAHAAGAASIGGAGAGLAPASGAGGTSVGVTATSATATGATGTSVTATATTTAVGASAGSATSVGALVGGGLITKLAVGGAVVALAAAGAVAVRHRVAQANAQRATRAQLASFAARGSAVAEIAGSSEGPYGALGPGSTAVPISAIGTADSADLGLLTGLSGSGGANPLLTLAPTSAPSLLPAGAPGQPTEKAGPSDIGGNGGDYAKARKARAKRRRAALRRRRLQRARRLRKARRRARLRKALRRRHLAAPKLAKSPKPPQPAVAPAPVRAHRRKARPTPALVTAGAPAETTTGNESEGTKGHRHRSAAGAGATGASTTKTGTTSAGATGAGTSETGTGTTSTGKRKGKAGSGAGAEKAGSTGAQEAGSGAGAETSSSGAGTGKTDTETGSGKTGSAATTSPSTITTAKGGAVTTGGKGTTTHPKKHLVEEEQLPNL